MTMNGDTGENNSFTNTPTKMLVYVLLCQKHKYNSHYEKWMQDIQRQRKLKTIARKITQVGNLENTFM